MKIPVSVVSVLMYASVILAQDAPASQQGPLGPNMIIMMALMFAIVYFLMIRPEQKKQKERQKMIEAIAKGDKVVTAGGIHGTVQQVKENTINVRIADGVTAEFTKSSVTTVADKKDKKVVEEKKK